MDPYSQLAKPSRLGLATALGAASGVLILLCLIFELVVPAAEGPGANYLGLKNLNFRSIILYATAGGLHILLCVGGTIFFYEHLRRSESKLEFKKIVLGILIAFGAVLSIVLIACYLDINLVQQSYHERIRPLQSDIRLSALLATNAIPFTASKLHPFALYPLALVFFGVAVAVVGCFWISHKATTFAHRADSLEKHEILELKEIWRN